MIVDSHVHLWTLDPDRYPWQPLLGYIPTQPFTSEQLLQLMDEARVDHAVVVQPSVYGWDNSYVLDAVDAHPTRLVAVALLDHQSAEWPARLRALHKRGVRAICLTLSEESAAWITEPTYRGLWRALVQLGLPAVFQARMEQLGAVESLASKMHELQIVIDHLGKPDLTGGSEGWERLLRLSESPCVYVKVSGFHEQGDDWRRFPEVIADALATFGAERLVWGSDAPGVLRSAAYEDTMVPVRAVDLSEEQENQIFGKTAFDLFKIAP